MRRCNLACGYCNEYDHTSKPIDLEIVKSRLNRLQAGALAQAGVGAQAGFDVLAFTDLYDGNGVGYRANLPSYDCLARRVK